MSSKPLFRSFAFWAFFCVSVPTLAQPLTEPKARVVLTLSGKIGKTNAPGLAQLDLAMLNSLPQETIRTRTPWYPGISEFTGPLLADVLSLVEATGTVIRASAMNDYSVSIPVSDANNHRVVLATSLNGKPMSIRNKGPLFIIYPFDLKDELRAATYYERSIWQLKSLELK